MMVSTNGASVVRHSQSATGNNWLFGDGDAHVAHRRAETFFDEVIAHAYGWNLEAGKVISIYGAGGEGKSIFIKNLKQYCIDYLPDNRWRTIYLDFYSEVSSTIRELHSIFEAFASAGLFCPRFSMAYHSYQHHGNREQAANSYLIDCNKFIDGTSLVDDVSQPIGSVLGIASIACDLLSSSLPIPPLRDAVELYFEHRGRTERERAIQDARTLWDDIADYDRQTLLSRMPLLLQQDIDEAVNALVQRHLPCRPLIIVDSFEHLLETGTCNVLSGVGELMRNFTHIPGTLWVVAGRNKLDGEGWDNVIHYPIELIDLDLEETAALLRDHGIDDPNLARDIYEFSGGLPLFVTLCEDAIKQCSEEDRRLSFAELVRDHGTRERLLQHFVNRMDDDMEIAVYAMSYLHEWGDDLLIELLGNHGLMDKDMAELVAEDATALSFVIPRGDRYQMHERIAAMLRSLKPETRNMRMSYKKLFASLCDACDAAKDDADLNVEELHHLRLVLCRAIWEMSLHVDSFYKRIDAGRLFDRRLAYLGELEWAGLREEALTVIDKMLPLYQDLERRSKLRLRRSASLSQMFILTDNVAYHLEALEGERRVLADLESDHADHSALLFQTRNSIGLSLTRLAEKPEDVEEALGYLRPNYELVCSKTIGEMNAGDTNALSNYGLACLKANEHCAGAGQARQHLKDALNAYKRAVAAREQVFGKEDPEKGRTHVLTLRCLTNQAITLDRLGRLDEAQSLYDLVEQRFVAAGYVKGQPGWLYNRYHKAINLELVAEALAEAGDRDGAIRTLEEAHRQHLAVLADRRRYHDGEQAMQKSEDQVAGCEERLARWQE